jgi:hypothetical protein
MKMFLLVAVAVIALMDIAYAETPLERCVTVGSVNVNTLPLPANKMWHQADVLGKTFRQADAIWFKLPNGTDIDLYVSYVDPQGAEWDWASATNIPGYGDAIVSGWVKHSSLKCPRED